MVALVIGDAGFQLFKRLLAEAGQGRGAAILKRRFKLLDRPHLQRFPKQRDTFGPHPGQSQQLQHGRLVAREQLFPQRKRAGPLDLLNVGGHALADAGDGEQFFGLVRERAQLDRARFHGFSSAPVRADAERVARSDLEQVRGFVQQGSDLAVLHLPIETDARSPFLPERKPPRNWVAGRWMAQAISRCRTTWSACGPFCPWMTSNSTSSPSFRLLYPSI